MAVSVCVRGAVAEGSSKHVQLLQRLKYNNWSASGKTNSVLGLGSNRIFSHEGKGVPIKE